MMEENEARQTSGEENGIAKDPENIDSVLAAEHAWLKMRRENEDLRRKNEVMAETMRCLQEEIQRLEEELSRISGEARSAEERIEKERQEREGLEHEAQQLRLRLQKAVDLVAEQRSKGWWKRFF